VDRRQRLQCDFRRSFDKGMANLMLRKTSLKVVALALVLILSGAQLAAQTTRINFRRGSSSATVRGKIGPKGYLEYVVNGRAGQLMSIEITSGNGAVIVNAGSASGKSFSLDMSGGDHLLSIVNTGRGQTTYSLTVSIK
jgi:hypothetical protein